MTHPVTCRECGHVNQVDTSRAGEKYLCGGCGMMDAAPAASPTSEPALLRFACPACGRKFATKPTLAGQKIRCKGCGAGVRVPAPGAKSSAAVATSHAVAPTVNRTTSPKPAAAPPPPATGGDDDSIALLDDLAAIEGGGRRSRAEAVLPSRTEAMEQVRQKVAEQEAVEAQQKAEKAKKKRKKKKKGSSYFDPKDTLILVGGVTAFVAVLAFLSWGYPDLRFPVGGLMCIVGFIVYLIGAASIRQVVAEEGVHHVILFRFFPPYQWYFVATRWAETKDFVAFFGAGLIILAIGGVVIKSSPIGKKAQESEEAYQNASKGNLGDSEPPPVMADPDDE